VKRKECQCTFQTALAMDPQILVLHEPSAGLDPRARRNPIQLLRERSKTMLVASHDRHLVWDLCPRTVILDQGRVAADGPTTELLQDHGLMDRHGLEVAYPSPGPESATSSPHVACKMQL
jgi:cobalt/nickel transport system ATP-binding protein